jgi:hypothetical protein
MSDDTLTALVKELRLDRTTGEVIDEIQNRWRRRLSQRERRTVIEYCSRFSNWGHTQYVAAPPRARYLPIEEDLDDVYKLHAAERRSPIHELMLCVLRNVANEDLLDFVCPPVGSV